MSFFKRLFGKETPEEKAAREEKEAKEKAEKAEKERLEKEAKAAKEAAEAAEKAAKKEREEKEKADKEYFKKHGHLPPPPPAASTPAGAPPISELSHEQQMKLQAKLAQQQMAAQQQQPAANAAPGTPAVSSSIPPSNEGNLMALLTPTAGAAALAMPAPGSKCQDCGAATAAVQCIDCAASGGDSLFCSECDSAFHRGKRAAHVRRPAYPEPVPVPAAQPAAVVQPQAATVDAQAAAQPTPAQPQAQTVPAAAASAPAPATAQPAAVEPPQPQPSPAALQSVIAQGGQPLVGLATPLPAPSPQSATEAQQQPAPAQLQPLQPLGSPLAGAAPFSSSFALPASATPVQTSAPAPVEQQPQQPSPAPAAQPAAPQPVQQMAVESLDEPAPVVQPPPPQQQQPAVQPTPAPAPSEPSFIPSDLPPAQPQVGLPPASQPTTLLQQTPQKPIMPPVPVHLAQSAALADAISGTAPAAAAAGDAPGQSPRTQQQRTPRNADGSINFNAAARHTPRTPRDEQSPPQPQASPVTMQQLQYAQQQQQQQQPPSARSRAIALMAENNDIATLSPEEVEELRAMFKRYDSNGDEHLALHELGKFLHELEFTYNDDFLRFLVDHIFGKHIHQRVVNAPNSQRSIRGMLTFDEFVDFMSVFYWLHDHVYSEIERQFKAAFGKNVDDECVAILCKFVNFNQHAELDFNEMNQRLVEAVNAEHERAQEEARRALYPHATESEVRNLSSPLQQQHLQQQRKEDELKNLEAQRQAELKAKDLEEAQSAQRREEEEKARLQAQREQFRNQAIQIQQANQAAAAQQHSLQLSPVSEYPDANEDKPRRSALDAEDPFAAHGGSGGGQAIGVAGPASLLAMSLDAADEEFMKRSWSQLLKYFDRDRKGGLASTDLAQALRAMGLEPNAHDLEEFFAKADVDGSGVISYSEFRSYYSNLYHASLRKGLELGQLKRVFASFDEDGDGRVTTAEFRHVVRQACPSDTELSPEDADRLVRLADVNNDGEISWVEFLDLIKLSTADAPPPPPPGTNLDDNARHEQLMAFHAARALTKKIMRSAMPTPMEMVSALAHMPSTFRHSMLAKFQSREEFFPSSILNPVLHSSGLHYEQLQLDPRTLALRPQPLHSDTGAPQANFLSYHLELEYASGIPLPDVSHRSDIVARRVRVCILEGNKPLSNLYMVKAEWDASEEDRWKFQLKFMENDLNSMAFKFTAKECTVLFEFTCLVKKHTDKPNKDAPLSASSFVEMCCGFATLDLDLSTPLTKETRLVRPVMAGNLDQSVAIKDSEVLARRSGFKAFTQLFSGPVKSQLSLKLAPAHLRDERTVNYLRFLPCNLIAAWSTIEVLKLFLEVLASFILLPQHQPLHVGRTCQLAIQLFLKNIVDTPDMLQVLSEVWSETRKGIKRVALSQHDAGAMQHVSTGPAADPTLDTSPASVLLKFRRCIMRMYPAATLATNVLPPYIVGITDLKRLSLLRVLAHTADPLTVLTSDGMLRGVNATAGAGAGGGAAGVTRAPMSLARAASVQNIKADVAAAAAAASAPQHDPRRPAGLGFNKGVVAASAPDEPLGPDPYVGSVELRNIWAPFHTNEISFDANAHSEDRHLERRNEIEFQLASSGLSD